MEFLGRIVDLSFEGIRHLDVGMEGKPGTAHLDQVFVLQRQRRYCEIIGLDGQSGCERQPFSLPADPSGRDGEPLFHDVLVTEGLDVPALCEVLSVEREVVVSDEDTAPAQTEVIKFLGEIPDFFDADCRCKILALDGNLLIPPPGNDIDLICIATLSGHPDPPLSLIALRLVN